jgi:uncharacterized protein (TIGR01777 family)
MKRSILVAGGSGFLGQELGISLVRAGHNVSLLTRKPEELRGTTAFPATKIFSWDDLLRAEHAESLSQVDVLINFCGTSIADSKWNAEGKAELRRSRVDVTSTLIESLKQAGCRPKLWLQASAVGYYGDRPGGEVLGESSEMGEGFLSELCRDWEQSCQSIEQQTRVVYLRISPILDLAGGMLGTLDQLYAGGLGASLGSHGLPWMHIEDFCAAIQHCIANERVSGPVNFCSPSLESYDDFHKALCKQKQVISLPGPPKFLLRAVLGEKSTFLTNSQQIIPQKLLDTGFQFKFKTLESAFSDLYADQLKAGVFWLTRKIWIPRSTDELWPFFSNEHNLEQITPPLLNFHVKSKSTSEIEKNTLIHYRLKLHGIPIRWTSRIAVWNPPHEFVDTQIKGPYSYWYHRHLFEPMGNGTLATDRVQYKLPMGAIGTYLASRFVRSDVEKIFDYRTTVIKKLFGEAQ